jgi:hypothetical protein
LFGQIVLQSNGHPFEIPSAVAHFFVELRGCRFEKDLVNAWFLPNLLTERLSRTARVSIGSAPRQLAAGIWLRRSSMMRLSRQWTLW